MPSSTDRPDAVRPADGAGAPDDNDRRRGGLGPRPDGAAPAPPERLTGSARAWRIVVITALAVGFLGGTTIGDDDWWPFSPWRMFSTSTPVTGSVAAAFIEVRTTRERAWTPAPLMPSSVGLNRAEIEGRLDAIRADPSLLATLAASHARLCPDDPPWTGVRVALRHSAIVDGRATGRHTDVVLATWEAP